MSATKPMPATNRTYRGVVRLAKALLGVFFRRVEISGMANIPEDGGGLLVSWHPNGMIDPSLIFCSFPRRVVFGARHGLFNFPVLGQLMRAVGTVPIYRAMDGGDEQARREANARSLDALAGQLADTSYSCLFPEGDSHDGSAPTRARSGAARLYYRARQLQRPDQQPPVIIPVGLFYDDKAVFRSKALLVFHPPMTLPPELDVRPAEGEPDEAEQARVKALTGEIDQVLREVVHATDSWELHHLMNRVRKLVRAERAARAGSDLHKPDMKERVLGFARVRAGYKALAETHPEQVAALQARVEEYDEDLRALKMEDHDLDRSPRLVSPWLVALLLLQFVFVFLLLPPILLVGYLVNGPPALLLMGIAKATSKRQKDEATAKLFLGALLFPVCWALAAVGAALLHNQLAATFPNLPESPTWAAVTTLLLSALGGAVAVRYLRVARETLRALRVRLTRQRAKIAVARLKVERAELHDAIMALVEGVALPGKVGADGRIVGRLDEVGRPAPHPEGPTTG